MAPTPGAISRPAFWRRPVLTDGAISKRMIGRDSDRRATLAESRGQERGRHSGPGEYGGHVVQPRLDRVAFDDRPTVSLHMIDCCAKELNRQPFSPLVAAHEKTGDRPDRLVIHRLEDARATEGWIISPAAPPRTSRPVLPSSTR